LKSNQLSPTFTGVVTCTNGITAGDNVLTASSKPTGGNVSITIENTGANGFASCYWKAPNESGQIFVGQLGGLNLRTNTAHPIQSTTYTGEEGGAPTSMKILANATRDVEILSPLNIKSLSTVIDNGVTIGGNLTVSGFTNTKPYASLRVTTTGGGTFATPSTGTTVETIGTPGAVTLVQYGFLTNVSVARGSTGTTNLFLYSFTLPTAHPLGTNYIVNGGFYTAGSLALSPNAFLTFNVASSTNFSVWVRSSTGILMDGNFYVYTVP
jgi:hypothetical protein